MNARLTDQPALARTDLAGSTPALPPRAPSLRAVRRAGLGLAAGTLCWAVAIFVLGPTGVGVGERIVDLTGLLFQFGLFGLLWVQARTRAIGASRAVSVALGVEAVLLGLAALWSLLHGLLPDSVDGVAWLTALDVCWPLSMLGMAAVSVKLAVTGRWQGALRWWPLIAESWAIVTVPADILFGEGVSRWIGGGHLVIGYATLGLLLALWPQRVLGAGQES